MVISLEAGRGRRGERWPGPSGGRGVEGALREEESGGTKPRSPARFYFLRSLLLCTATF